MAAVLSSRLSIRPLPPANRADPREFRGDLEADGRGGGDQDGGNGLFGRRYGASGTARATAGDIAPPTAVPLYNNTR